jgi:hypothetical protein
MHPFLAILAQLQDSAPALYTYGPMGVILAWFMWRGEKLSTEVRSLAHRIDGLTRALLVDMMNRETTGPTARRYAAEAIAQIEARQNKRDGE